MNRRSVIHQPAAQMMGGHAVGILVLNTGYPLLPGNVANATTYDFPVRYKVVEGATSPQLLAGNRALVDATLRAAEELVRDGCRAIVGACGYFANFQTEVAEALPVPVFMSSLCQVPMLTTALRPGQRLGILCASGASLGPATLAAAGVSSDAPIVVAGLEGCPEFRSSILEDKGWFDGAKVEDEVIDAAVRLTKEHPEVGALLLECSDLPPYARLIQEATGLPVWDYVSLIKWIYNGVVRRDFDGFI